MSLRWHDFPDRSILEGEWVDTPRVWLNRTEGCWKSTVANSTWATREAAKSATVAALKARALDLHSALCELAGVRESELAEKR